MFFAFQGTKILSLEPQNFALWEFEVFRLTRTHFPVNHLIAGSCNQNVSVWGASGGRK